MTARFSRQLELEVPAAQLLTLITDADFQRRKALDFGALDASCSRVDHENGSVELVLRETSPARWGGPRQSEMTFRWDCAAMQSRWRRVIIGYEDRSRAEGTSRIVAAADGRSCQFVLEGEVEVRVPILGRHIERQVVEEVERERERERELRYLRAKLGLL